eukprot:gnl/MRDRNA2_/MRDRNA2_102916_c0_seq1.p1 gnl/MRDRNA2_/MRDRNA2_102916_c0~~gnl/MRDRNA2_/MRDRNA2_102916_c0_seq1.p1  ORF type:complete len:157 (+),score=52.97 gnl/MRDRNA2_/MRDRNA2_102916_c0_seq1:122-592(+)
MNEANKKEYEELQRKQQRLEAELEELHKTERSLEKTVLTHELTAKREELDSQLGNLHQAKKALEEELGQVLAKKGSERAMTRAQHKDTELEPYFSQDDLTEDSYIAEIFGPVMDDFVLAVLQSLPEDGHVEQDWLFDFMVKWLDAKALDDERRKSA